MIKALIKNLAGETTHGAIFSTEQLAQSWVSQESQNKSFGKIERWLTEYQAQLEGENIEGKESRQVETPFGEIVTEYRFPQEFTVEYIDVTAQAAAEQKISTRLTKQNFGALMIAKITELNDLKDLSQEQLGVLLTDPQALTIERLLWSGSLNFARAAIAGYQGSLYSTEEKAALVAEIDLFLSNQ